MYGGIQIWIMFRISITVTVLPRNFQRIHGEVNILR